MEMLDTWAWYEGQRAGLGHELVGCVDAAIARAARSPDLDAPVHGDVRRILVRRFPYAVFYFVEGETIVVLAVAHASREPGFWLGRR
jgi:plasmid stabilization system protein ParE